MKKRIWELDALRGLCILGMVIVHFVYDLVELYGFVNWEYPALYRFVMRWGGVLFLLISGICVTLGRRSVRRGLIVFGCGILCTAVTAGMYFLKLADRALIIYFGVLHCLGICMLLWPLCRRLPIWALALLGAVLIAGGFLLQSLPPVDFPWLIPLGLISQNFQTSDYFPLLPNLGFFLLGAVIGLTAYRKKQSLLPGIDSGNAILWFLQLCGRYSLWIYLLHQPILYGVFRLILLLR